ncbi:MAG: hypothetical protein RLZZ84_1034 [Pseudomonadota bacterium]
MSHRDQLHSAWEAISPHDHAALYRIGLEALDHDLGEVVVGKLAPIIADKDTLDHRLWHVLGLAHRSLLDSEPAHVAFCRAADLAPKDRLIAHGQARTALEAGMPATRLFRRARKLDPNNAEVILGQAAAEMGEGQADRALGLLGGVLQQNPGWIQGHSAYAKICRMHFPDRDYRAPLMAAMQCYPGDSVLALNAIGLALEAQDYDAALNTVDLARPSIGDLPELRRLQAVTLSESGRFEHAYKLFSSLPDAPAAATLIHPVRTLIRLGRLDEAARLAERGSGTSDDRPLWPYRALLWRLLDDPRWHWLEGDERLISVIDLPFSTSDLDRLAIALRTLHGNTTQPLGQSVRQGSQTDGNLFARAEPEIRSLRRHITEALRAHVARLPRIDPDHPTLAVARDPLRFAGAWSIRLAGQGHHVDHVHLEGWLSGVFYVTVPEAVSAGYDEAGCLAFGENRALLPQHRGFRIERPKPGRLVLFPSLLWHGTRSIGSGERLTVAFDMKRPAIA